MLVINNDGMVTHAGVIWRRFVNLEKGDFKSIAGIIVHQTDSSTAASTLAAYPHKNESAHFLIDKDGTLYQTASVHKWVNHVGHLRARCIAEHRCAPGEEVRIGKMSASMRSRYEHTKSLPAGILQA